MVEFNASILDVAALISSVNSLIRKCLNCFSDVVMESNIELLILIRVATNESMYAFNCVAVSAMMNN